MGIITQVLERNLVPVYFIQFIVKLILLKARKIEANRTSPKAVRLAQSEIE